MAEVHNLSVTDASNTARFPENQAPSTLNNGARALEGMMARYIFDSDHSVVATVSGSVIQMTINRVSVTMTSTTSNYVPNLTIAFQMGSVAQTLPASVRINNIQTLPLRDNRGNSLSQTFIPAFARALIVKDDTNNYFRLLRPDLPFDEMTWTPVLAFGGSSVDLTASSELGEYTRIGKTVFFNIKYVLTSKGSSVGNATLTLPLTAETANARIVFEAGLVDLNVAGGYQGFVAVTIANSFSMPLDEWGDNVGVAALTDADFSNTSSIFINGHYRVGVQP